MPRIGRVKVSSGLDAVDDAFSTTYGGATLSHFQVWAYQVARGTVATLRLQPNNALFASLRRRLVSA